MSKKPEKPWKLPDEQQHLAELKRTDKNAYEQERLMMENEYKSALLWYKNQKQKRSKSGSKEEPKKAVSSLQNSLKAMLKKAEKPVQKQKQKKQQSRSLKKPKEEIVKPVLSGEDSAKEKILAKIRREQERQLRKLQ